MSKEIVLDIDGMTCASCVQKVERALDSVEGVDAAAVSLATRTATVRGDLDGTSLLIGAVARAGYGARPHEGRRDPAEETGAYRRRLLVAAPLTIATLALSVLRADDTPAALLSWVLATPVVVWAGWPFFRNAARAARHATTTMDTLIALGAGSAYLYSAWQVVAARGTAEPAMHYFDTAAAIVTLILVGKLLEARARNAAGDASRALLARGASSATIVTDLGERTVGIDELRPGMRAIVGPGQKIPADGVVRGGSSWVDLSLLTGEATPVDVGPGDEVIGASINGDGRLEIFVTKVGANATLGEIVRLLQATQASRADIQRLADRVSSVFVPIVLALAAATLVGWLLLGAAFGQALLHATAVVLIACPCALGLATPAAIVAGTGRAAELGVLFRGGAAVEATAGIDTLLLDKTGTVTDGAMRLLDVHGVNGTSPDEVVAVAAAVERGSTHPIAHAVVRAADERSIVVPTAHDHRTEAGVGATARIDDAVARVGRPSGPADAMQPVMTLDGASTFAVWRDGVALGLIAVADHPKPEAADAVARLRSMGLEVGMVTGDARAAAAAVAAQVGIADVVADVRPEGKVAEIQRRTAAGRHVAFVGDGLNDAPALAAATVGMALGSGTDVALAAADVQLLAPSLRSVATAIGMARGTLSVIRQNLFWAFAYNVVMIPLAVVGALDPMWAAAAMAASSVSVVANALRLRRFRSAPSP